MSTPEFEKADLDAAVERLTEGSRLRDAEARVAAVAPALQMVLADALASGGWFEGSHRQEIERVAVIEEPHERATAIATLLAEETRISMMVGVAVGWALAEDLSENPASPQDGD